MSSHTPLLLCLFIQVKYHLRSTENEWDRCSQKHSGIFFSINKDQSISLIAHWPLFSINNVPQLALHTAVIQVVSPYGLLRDASRDQTNSICRDYRSLIDFVTLHVSWSYSHLNIWVWAFFFFLNFWFGLYPAEDSYCKGNRRAILSLSFLIFWMQRCSWTR